MTSICSESGSVVEGVSTLVFWGGAQIVATRLAFDSGGIGSLFPSPINLPNDPNQRKHRERNGQVGKIRYIPADGSGLPDSIELGHGNNWKRAGPILRGLIRPPDTSPKNLADWINR